MFDWITFLDRHGIQYKEGGKSTARGNVYVDCPYCGTIGRGKAHMGISTAGKGWGCWINGEHRGIAPQRLVQALLGCSRERAYELVGARTAPAPTTSSIANMLQELEDDSVIMSTKQVVEWPTNIKPITNLSGALVRPAFLYLKSRGYSQAYCDWLCDRYALRWTIQGPFAYRICIPVCDEEGALVTWVGRSTSATAELRYKALSQDVEKAKSMNLPAALAPITDCLLDQDLLPLGGDILVVTEGFFDAAKVMSSIARSKLEGLATCLFGQNISPAQRAKLIKVAASYKRKYVMLDADAALRGFFTVLQQLAPFGFEPIALPEGAKDPDTLPTSELRRLLRIS